MDTRPEVEPDDVVVSLSGIAMVAAVFKDRHQVTLVRGDPRPPLSGSDEDRADAPVVAAVVALVQVEQGPQPVTRDGRGEAVAAEHVEIAVPERLHLMDALG
ncbi:hypothetical protein [Streptomyces mirabilis]